MIKFIIAVSIAGLLTGLLLWIAECMFPKSKVALFWAGWVSFGLSNEVKKWLDNQ